MIKIIQKIPIVLWLFATMAIGIFIGVKSKSISLGVVVGAYLFQLALKYE
ncbi:MAG: hypothetical protein JXR54_10090 [Tannerellaceae bacterium]|nr:hypothetical protein [Tannerellaceae bacterium]